MPFNLRDKLNLEKQFTFYASYHNTPGNVVIHLCCIWPILASAICLLQHTPAFMLTPGFLANVPYGHLIVINVAFVAALVYILLYPIMEPFVGSIGSTLVFAIYMWTSHLVQQNTPIYGFPLWQVALGIHVFCWVMQFFGHGHFEGRAPALLDSWDQALLTAPLFVLMEVFFFLGYRKEFHKKIMKQVEKNIADFKKKSKAKKN